MYPFLLFSLVLYSCFGYSQTTDIANTPLVQSLDYKFDPQVYQDVIGDRQTELWARLYYPFYQEPFYQKPNYQGLVQQVAMVQGPLPRMPGQQKLPLVVILHGNHSTCGTTDFPRLDNSCEYTTKHQCSGNYQVIQNHLGFEYLAEELVKNGFIVLSINANLGINCGEGQDNDPGLTLARGRLILKHLQLLSDWNRGLNTDSTFAPILFNKIDFDRIGLIGHSRGGEGVRAALNLFRDPQHHWYSKIGPMNIKAIFEITPIDGEAGRILNPENVAWNVLLGACDGDVPNLEGIRVFDRMSLPNSESSPRPKSALLIWGANHNFFNSEWQMSDSMSCKNHLALFPIYPGSKSQRKIAIETAVPFFKNYLGQSEQLNLVDFFDPINPIKKELSDLTTIERSLVSQGTTFDMFAIPLENFFPTPRFGSLPELSQVAQKSMAIPEHEVVIVGSQLTWQQASPNTFAQFDWSTDESALDFPQAGFFELRIAVADQKLPELFDFSIQFVGAHQQLSKPVRISKYLSFIGPAAQHSLLQTLKIPVGDIQEISQIKGIRFVFDSTAPGKIYVNALYLRDSKGISVASSQRFSNQWEDLINLNIYTSNLLNLGLLNIGENQKIISQTENPNHTFNATFLGSSDRALRLNSPQLSHQLSFYSIVPFTPKSSLLVLAIGKQLFKISGFNSDGDSHFVNFFISDEEFKTLEVGVPIKIFYLSAPQYEVWNAGNWL